MAQATLINEAGKKVVVGVGSTEAQRYFGQGYQLMGASGQYEAPASTATPPANAPTTQPTQPNATLVNPETGDRQGTVAGSQEAQGLFGQGYVLETPENKGSFGVSELEDSPTETELDRLMGELKTGRQSYLDAIAQTGQRSEEEIRLQGDLADLDQAKRSDIRTAEGRIVPMGLIRGEKAGILKQYQDEEANLLTRLGFEKEAREMINQANLLGAEASLSFIGEDIDMQIRIEENMEKQRKALMDEMEKLTENATKSLQDIIKYSGEYYFEELTPETQQQIAQLAFDSGLPLDVAIGAINLSKEATVMQRIKDEAQVRNTNRLASGGTPSSSSYKFNPAGRGRLLNFMSNEEINTLERNINDFGVTESIDGLSEEAQKAVRDITSGLTPIQSDPNVRIPGSEKEREVISYLKSMEMLGYDIEKAKEYISSEGFRPENFQHELDNWSPVEVVDSGDSKFNYFNFSKDFGIIRDWLK